jgi:hypothetical protein
MFKIKIFTISLLLALNNVSFAEKITPSGVGCDTESGSCYIILSAPFSGTTCDANLQIRLDPNKKGTTGQYSAALAAFMAGKKLEVASSSCFEQHPTPAWLHVTN